MQRRGLLVASRRRTCLLEVETSELQAGQSKAYAFEVGPYGTGGGGGGCSSSDAGSSVSAEQQYNSSVGGDSRDSETGSTGITAEVAKVCAPDKHQITRRGTPCLVLRNTSLPPL